jgi:hypothetical protein
MSSDRMTFMTTFGASVPYDQNSLTVSALLTHDCQITNKRMHHWMS